MNKSNPFLEKSINGQDIKEQNRKLNKTFETIINYIAFHASNEKSNKLNLSINNNGFLSIQIKRENISNSLLEEIKRSHEVLFQKNQDPLIKAGDTRRLGKFKEFDYINVKTSLKAEDYLQKNILNNYKKKLNKEILKSINNFDKISVIEFKENQKISNKFKKSLR